MPRVTRILPGGDRQVALHPRAQCLPLRGGGLQAVLRWHLAACQHLIDLLPGLRIALYLFQSDELLQIQITFLLFGGVAVQAELFQQGSDVALVGRAQRGQRVGCVSGSVQRGCCQQNADQRAGQGRYQRQATGADRQTAVVAAPVVENVGFHGRSSVQPRGGPAGQSLAEAWLCRRSIVHGAGGGATRWRVKRVFAWGGWSRLGLPEQ